MPRVRIGPAPPDRKNIDVEIARLRDLHVKALRAQWHNVLGRSPPPHLPRHLLFRILAYRLQANQLGDLDPVIRRVLDDAGGTTTALAQGQRELKPDTVLSREWNGKMHRVAVLTDGFAYYGKTYSSLSKIALAITGTRWNGPRFFGLRENKIKGSPAS
jgi:hypothetical protein